MKCVSLKQPFFFPHAFSGLKETGKGYNKLGGGSQRLVFIGRVHKNSRAQRFNILNTGEICFIAIFVVFTLRFGYLVALDIQLRPNFQVLVYNYLGLHLSSTNLEGLLFFFSQLILQIACRQSKHDLFRVQASTALHCTGKYTLHSIMRNKNQEKYPTSST